MKSTGIVRRIDDLGRIMMPKEIRRTLGIREGDPFEIFINDGMVCYKKYEPENDYIDSIGRILNNLSEDIDIDNGKKDILKFKMEEIILLLKEK